MFVELCVEFMDFLNVQFIGKDDKFLCWVFVFVVLLCDCCFGFCGWIVVVDVDICLICQLVGCIGEEICCFIGVGQDDVQVVVVFFVLIGQYVIGCVV